MKSKKYIWISIVCKQKVQVFSAAEHILKILLANLLCTVSQNNINDVFSVLSTFPHRPGNAGNKICRSDFALNMILSENKMQERS